MSSEETTTGTDARDLIGHKINVLDHGYVRLVDFMGSDRRVEDAARTCYGEGTRAVSETRGLIRYLMRHQHTTPFEMVRFTFEVMCPKFIQIQWFRHRMASYNEYSLRYSTPLQQCYVPDESVITSQSTANRQGGSGEVVLSAYNQQQDIIDMYNMLQTTYDEFTAPEVDMRRELARTILPFGQYTKFYTTIDLHNLFHFLKLRLDSHAQYEIRVYGEALAEFVKHVVPLSWEAFVDYHLEAETFSRAELQVIKNVFLTPHVFTDKEFEGTRLGKRERKDFITKLQKLIDKR